MDDYTPTDQVSVTVGWGLNQDTRSFEFFVSFISVPTAAGNGAFQVTPDRRLVGYMLGIPGEAFCRLVFCCSYTWVGDSYSTSVTSSCFPFWFSQTKWTGLPHQPSLHSSSVLFHWWRRWKPRGRLPMSIRQVLWVQWPDSEERASSSSSRPRGLVRSFQPVSTSCGQDSFCILEQKAVKCVVLWGETCIVDPI